MDGLHHIGPADRQRFLGVLYAEDFDAPGVEPDPVPVEPDSPEPTAPTYTEAELAAAKAAAAQDAVAAAMQAWKHDAGLLRAAALDRIASALARSRESAQDSASEIASEAARTVLALLGTLLPHLCRLHGDEEVRAVLRHLLPQFASEPRITVRVHPAVLGGVQQDLQAMDPDLTAAVTLAPLDTLGRGDVRVSWRDGSLARDVGAMASALNAALAELGLLGAPHDARATISERRTTHAQ